MPKDFESIFLSSAQDAECKANLSNQKNWHVFLDYNPKKRYYFLE